MNDDVLKGNFTTKREVTVEADKEPSLEERFEMEALKKLGGSMAFVSKKKVMWNLKDKC
jgi:hypothetical protein